MISASLYQTHTLPEKVIIGYPSWYECDEKVIKAVQQGVNVIIWFSINLITNPVTGLAEISGGPDLKCIANLSFSLQQQNLSTTHLISIGGWDSPHPDTKNKAIDYYNAWIKWNNASINSSLGFNGFDGFDWDIEGNDDLNSPYNQFTIECLDLMGEMSQLAKKDGFIVTMAPAESYLDVKNSGFDRSLKHNYPEWEVLQPNFTYHGRNVHAYLLAKYGYTRVHETSEIITFDLISVQFYEGYSHIEYSTSILKEKPSDYLVNIITRYIEGWTVNFEQDPDVKLKNQIIRIPKENFIVGLANGWAGDGKFLLIEPEEIEIAYNKLKAKGMEVRGFMFWDIADEGKVPVNKEEEFWLAAGLNKFMKTRKIYKSEF